MKDQPTHATAQSISALRVSDLEKTVTLGEVIGALSAPNSRGVSAITDLVEALIEHWTDDEGLHWQPFQDELEKELTNYITQTVVDLIN